MVMEELVDGDDIRYAVIFVTANGSEQGMSIARALVDDEIVACVNVVDKIRSVFRWKGKIEEESESLLIIKTQVGRIQDVIARVKELHSYDVPEIIAVPIVDGNPSYLAWIEEVT